MSLSAASDPSTAPVLLVLDTATERLHVGLCADGATWVRDLPGGAQASAQLLPVLQTLLREAGLGWHQVQAIGFGRGPGAFTGLRTACSVTQGLALGLGCPVLSIDTLMAVAEDARQQAASAGEPPLAPEDELWVLQDARMGELYVGAFRWLGSAWQVAQPPALWPQDEPRRRWAQAGTPVMVCGNALSACAQALSDLPALRPLATDAAPRGEALLALAQRAWAHGEAIDAALALPTYVRDKVAQTTAERQAPSLRQA